MFSNLLIKLNITFLLRNRKNVNFRSNDFAAAACLPPDQQHPASGTLCWAAGWGTTESNGELASILQEVDVEIIDDETCLKTENYLNGYKHKLIVDQMFCAGYLEGGKDTCQVSKSI